LPVPAVVTVHDLTFFEHPEWHERGKVAYFRPMIRASTRRAAVVVAVSEDTASRLRSHSLPSDRSSSRRTASTTTVFTTRADIANDDSLLAAYGIVHRSSRSTGTIEPRKGLPTLVEAFARIAGADRRLRSSSRAAKAGGRTTYATQSPPAAFQHACCVRATCPDAAVAPFFRRAAVVAYPSLAEGFRHERGRGARVRCAAGDHDGFRAR